MFYSHAQCMGWCRHIQLMKRQKRHFVSCSKNLLVSSRHFQRRIYFGDHFGDRIVSRVYKERYKPSRRFWLLKTILLPLRFTIFIHSKFHARTVTEISGKRQDFAVSSCQSEGGEYYCVLLRRNTCP